MGYTHFAFVSTPINTVHPHACGVYKVFLLSSQSQSRFIPTHVGYTNCSVSKHFQSSGSSPRMWGILDKGKCSEAYHSVHPHACGVYGIAALTPALIPAVHPHACGVYEISEKWIQCDRRFIPTHVGYTENFTLNKGEDFGSSPRMWGIHIHGHTIYHVLPVHPHACGVYDYSRQRRRGYETVHPHACGVYVPLRQTLCDDNRFIPTHVGYTAPGGD